MTTHGPPSLAPATQPEGWRDDLPPPVIDGDRGCSNPPAWRLVRTGAARDLAVVPSWSMLYAIVACYVVMTVVLWVVGSRFDAELVAVLGFVSLQLFCAIMLLLAVANIRRGPYLVVRGGVVRGRALDVGVAVSSVVTVEIVTGRPRRRATRVRELNLLYRHADGTIRRLPVVGGLGREVDALAATLASALSVPRVEQRFAN